MGLLNLYFDLHWLGLLGSFDRGFTIVSGALWAFNCHLVDKLHYGIVRVLDYCVQVASWVKRCCLMIVCGRSTAIRPLMPDWVGEVFAH